MIFKFSYVCNAPFCVKLTIAIDHTLFNYITYISTLIISTVALTRILLLSMPYLNLL